MKWKVEMPHCGWSAPMPDETTSPPAPAPAPGTITPQELKKAMKAFKKRLEITQLDKESRQIAGPLSKGRGSGIVGIVPPRQFPQAIWDELVKQGRLKYIGDGLYGMPG